MNTGWWDREHRSQTQRHTHWNGKCHLEISTKAILKQDTITPNVSELLEQREPSKVFERVSQKIWRGSGIKFVTDALDW